LRIPESALFPLLAKEPGLKLFIAQSSGDDHAGFAAVVRG